MSYSCATSYLKTITRCRTYSHPPRLNTDSTLAPATQGGSVGVRDSRGIHDGIGGGRRGRGSLVGGGPETGAAPVDTRAGRFAPGMTNHVARAHEATSVEAVTRPDLMFSIFLRPRRTIFGPTKQGHDTGCPGQAEQSQGEGIPGRQQAGARRAVDRAKQNG